jgi:hypothetical protein
MSNTIKGILSGLIATLALSAVMLAKVELHIVPASTVISLLSKLAGGTVGGWMDHFIIGTVIWGLAFAGFDSVTPERIPYWLKGVIFSILAWLVMMLFFLPYVGLEPFGLKLGLFPAVVNLAQHLIYGLVLGTTYGLLTHWVPAKSTESSAQT